MASIAEAAVRVETWRSFGPITVKVMVHGGAHPLKTYTVYGRVQWDSAPDGALMSLDDLHIYAGDYHEPDDPDDEYEEQSYALRPQVVDRIWDEVGATLRAIHGRQR